MRFRKWSLIALLVTRVWDTRAAEAAERFSREQILMGNVPVSITVEASASKKEKTTQAMEMAFQDARRIENEVSEWRPESQATLLNQNAGKALVPVGKDMMAILLKAREVSEMTDGAFDITFASKSNRNFRDVIVIPELGLATLRPGVKIGVSGIAKGYIVDAMSGVLRKAGFGKFLVNAGDLYAAGKWKIGIRDPDRPGGGSASGGSLCEIAVQNQAVSTSGQYERGAHIIDPRTRKPATGLKSVTVIASESVTADAWATGLFVLGERAEEILKNHPELRAIIIDREGKVLPQTGDWQVSSDLSARTRRRRDSSPTINSRAARNL